MDRDLLLHEPLPGGLFSRLTRVGLLLDDFQHRCFDDFGLRFIEYTVLKLLQLSGAPYELSPSQLTEAVLRSTGGMTQILDRLEREGLVQRSPDRTDRRRVIVGLTPAGLDLVDRASAHYYAEKDRVLAGLGQADVARLDEAVITLLRLLAADAGVPEEATAPR